jgi:hypothetical protein
MATLKKHEETSQRKMMPGSDGGKYFPFARQGNVLLGVRLQMIESGSRYGADNITYFTLRLRSAPENGLFADEDKAKKVVKLAKNPENLWDAWPGVVWEKKDKSRASTTVGVFEHGSFRSKDPVALKTLLGNISEGKLAEKLTSHLVDLAGEKNLVCRRSELKAFLDEGFGPVIAKIVDNIKKYETMSEAIQENVGSVMMHAALVKKLFGEQPANSEAIAHEDGEVPDAQEGHDEDQDV